MENIVIPITLDDLVDDKLKYIVRKITGEKYPSAEYIYDFKQKFFEKNNTHILCCILPDFSVNKHNVTKIMGIKNILTDNSENENSVYNTPKKSVKLELKAPPAPQKKYHNKYMQMAYAQSQNCNGIEESIQQDENEYENKPFKNCSLKKYGKGFLLIPNSDHPDFGTKYYDNGAGDTGWWMPKKNGWFFKKQFIQPLIKGGAEIS
tara:strand:- start:330 stop:947 length:618 start_codon:yes stop_codon:yes gene_type:complete